MSAMPGGGIGGGNPQMAGAMQQLAQLPTEKLQELAARTGGTQQGMMAQRVLQQRLMMPNAQLSAPAQQPQLPAASAGGNMIQPGSGIAPTQSAAAAGVALPPTTNAMQRGGGIARQHFDMGGMPSSQEDPWWTRSAARGETGMIHAYSPGRTDTINMEPLAGSYIIPADVISGIGEGNSLAGAQAMDRMLGSGPRGIPMPRGEHGRGPPAPPRAPRLESRGGQQPGAAGARVPIIAAGGEYQVSPEQVRALGRGDMKRGHDLLDAFVLEVRRRTIKDLKHLPGPKKK